jgi:4'-phosphopantetheinyl transferase
MLALRWPAGPEQVTLAPDEVHVWCASLEQPAEEVERRRRVLSADEQERARRYALPAPRSQFILARSFLRFLLGRYLGCAPTAVRFGTSDRGKPRLLHPTPHQSLHFNVSHSRSLVLVALSVRGEVGVDIEYRRLMENFLDLARRFFTPAEAQGLSLLSDEHGEDAFFRIWTCKEAFLKLTGLGLAHGLDRVEISIDLPSRLLRLDGQTEPSGGYALENLHPAEGYVGALAVESGEYRLNCWGWQKPVDSR